MAMVQLQTGTPEQSAAPETLQQTMHATPKQAGQRVLAARNQPPGQKGVQVTERALRRIRIAIAKEGVSPEQGGLRLGITGGGCSGLSYNIKFDTQPRERDRVYEFADQELRGDESPAVKVFVDPKSFIYLNGMVLDYEETLMRQGFNFINPNSSKSCGCGSSFSA